MNNEKLKSDRHQKFFDEAVSRLKEVSANTSASIVCDSIASNKRMAELLTESRILVEDGVCNVIDAMDLVFEKNGEKVKQLESLVEKTSSQVAFLKTSLSSVAVKTVEVETLIQRMEKLNSAVDKFNSFVESGCFDLVVAAARGIEKS